MAFFAFAGDAAAALWRRMSDRLSPRHPSTPACRKVRRIIAPPFDPVCDESSYLPTVHSTIACVQHRLFFSGEENLESAMLVRSKNRPDRLAVIPSGEC